MAAHLLKRLHVETAHSLLHDMFTMRAEMFETVMKTREVIASTQAMMRDHGADTERRIAAFRRRAWPEPV